MNLFRTKKVIPIEERKIIEDIISKQIEKQSDRFYRIENAIVKNKELGHSHLPFACTLEEIKYMYNKGKSI